ncbi:MAG: stage II sporulation protein D [Tyzzerella sp.]|uniref:Stage II sporulation protein D n=1 Tax=Candidatus Fimicola merdigallinarum TaxID=2840819 RepID=A0A9D9DZ49_9FIRM|nr:stage II sporulation protein D [Candidatus Fimicola merdigallinarum]
MKKIITLIVITTILISFIIPMFTVFSFSKKDRKKEETSKQEINIEVYNPETETKEETPFEEYIKGVVGAEMPALFNIESLKAQAVCARTYALREIEHMGLTTENLPKPEDIGQAYLSKSELKERWGDNFEEYYKRIEQAVSETSGEIMVYDDEPILAVFHSTSSGYTENSENIWQNPMPYLKSVESSGDTKAPQYEVSKEISYNEIKNMFKNKYPDIVFSEDSLINQIKINSISDAGYITSVTVGNKNLTGLEIRGALSLRSASFTMNDTGNSIIFTTKGYGHGAGMSQYGAEAMANEGYTYKEILQHYYTNIDFKNIN